MRPPSDAGACSTSTTCCSAPPTLLGDDPGFAERMQWRYRHLSVDEFQDVNPAQFRLILALAGDQARPLRGR